MIDQVDPLTELSQETETASSDTSHNARNSWIGWALALSLVLHLGAAALLIVAGGSTLGGNTSSQFIIEDVLLIPTISAPVKPAPPLPEQHSAMPSTPPPENKQTGETTLPAEEPAATVPAPSSESSEQAGTPMSTPLGLGMTHGYFSSLADGRTLRDDIRDYYFEMVQKINRSYWDQAARLKEPLRQDAVFDLKIQRDGTILAIQVLNSTGSREIDHLLMDIIMKASPLPALPPTFSQDRFMAPLRIKAPSFFFRLKQ